MYLIKFSKQANKNKKMLKRAGLEEKTKNLLNIIAANPFQNPPPYEGLVGNLNGYYSRRISLQHRLVYEIYTGAFEADETHYEGIVKIDRMWTHYSKIR